MDRKYAKCGLGKMMCGELLQNKRVRENGEKNRAECGRIEECGKKVAQMRFKEKHVKLRGVLRKEDTRGNGAGNCR